MIEYLPSKRFFVFALVVGLVVFGYYKANQPKKDSVVVGAVSQQSLIEIKGFDLVSGFKPADLPESEVLPIKPEPRIKTEYSYNLSNIRILDSERREDAMKYGLELRGGLAAFETESPESELTAFIALYKKWDKSKISFLESRARLYLETADKLILLKVPGSLASQHLKIVRAFETAGKLVDGMSLALTDKELALQSADHFTVEAPRLVQHLSDLNTLFASRNIKFENTKPLYFTIPE